MTLRFHGIADVMFMGWSVLAIFGALIIFCLLIKGSLGDENETGISVGLITFSLLLETVAVFTSLGLSHSH